MSELWPAGLWAAGRKAMACVCDRQAARQARPASQQCGGGGPIQCVCVVCVATVCGQPMTAGRREAGGEKWVLKERGRLAEKAGGVCGVTA